MNYYNANNEDNINIKNNKGLDQVPDSPEADLKRLFNPAMVVEDTVPKQTSEQWGDLTQLLDKFQTIFSQNKYDVGCINLEPQRIHLISDLPISLRPYRNSQQESKEIQTQIEELLKAGFIRPSHSPYAAPVTLAYKKDEGKRSRLCINYRKLNEITRKDSTPVPLIDFVIDNLTHAKFFSTLDLTSGYWHIKIHEKDAEKLAFTTNFGLYEWLRLPFGWKNSPAVFQRTIRQILQKYQLTFALNYFDDIIIFSQSWEEHLTHLDTIFQICKKENIKLKKSKCQFAQEKIKFLGYEITQGHYSPSNPNIETIRKLAPPKDVKELQRFLGSINVYQKFIKDYAKLRVPLNKLLKKDAVWNWSHECQEAYQKLKNCLISKPILKLYNSQYPCHVFCDASQDSIGVVLKQQHPDGTLYPKAYQSRQLLKHEKNYTISEKECLAIIDALDKFHCYLHGSKFTIHTDHAALQWLKSVKHLTGRLFRWSLKLSQYEYSIVYIKAEEPFEMISLDTVGGFNYHNSQKKYLHIVLDHATRYAWTFPSKSVTSETYTNCLKQIFSIQCPKQLLSDRNAAFTSSKFKKFLKHHNIRQLLTSANRSQCNGKNERVNQTLVAKLRCKVNSTTKTPWTKLLEQVTYEYNNSPHDVTGFPPAYLMFGTLPYDSPLPNQVKLNYPPIQQARQIAVNRTIKHHKINKQRYDKHYVDAKFKVGDLVLYQNFSYPNSSKLQSPYNGPFKVVRKLSNVTYEIDKPNQYTQETLTSGYCSF
ncbi:retrovirus-related Pol polyprotein from transposon 17.6 [Trichonephila clavipes]|uniref:RNA-directed DNA polymerase n=1 Tax=Trichonephila clavipes TaxID=2585209 RepID=A0A8X6RPS8_TRICX|nr:retrovirus-related Pol polyprotein from transposon 17.6 [Trichonephila clavipes]